MSASAPEPGPGFLPPRAPAGAAAPRPDDAPSRPYRPPIGIPIRKERGLPGAIASILLHVLAILLLLFPFVGSDTVREILGAGGPGPAGGGGGGSGGTGGGRVANERLTYVQPPPPPPTAPDPTRLQPPEVVPPEPEPEVKPPVETPPVQPTVAQTAEAPKVDGPPADVASVTAGTGGGSGKDGGPGNGPGSGGGVGSGIGTVRRRLHRTRHRFRTHQHARLGLRSQAARDSRRHAFSPRDRCLGSAGALQVQSRLHVLSHTPRRRGGQVRHR